MSLLVDTSVWSLAFRRDAEHGSREVEALRVALLNGEGGVTTGMILLEVLRGVLPERARTAIEGAFATLEFVEPSRNDYVEAAAIATRCRRAGVQIGSVDALIAQLAIAGGHTLLTADRDFTHAARVIPLRLWG